MLGSKIQGIPIVYLSNKTSFRSVPTGKGKGVARMGPPGPVDPFPSLPSSGMGFPQYQHEMPHEFQPFQVLPPGPPPPLLPGVFHPNPPIMMRNEFDSTPASYTGFHGPNHNLSPMMNHSPPPDYPRGMVSPKYPLYPYRSYNVDFTAIGAPIAVPSSIPLAPPST